MIREDLEHAVCTSLRIERMTATFCRRLDRGATFIQVCLGLAVFNDVTALKIVGGAVAIISIWIFIYGPAPRAILAAQQQRRYENLSLKMARLTDAELEAEFAKVGETDSEEIEFICHAAENAGHRNIGSTEPFEIKWWQSILLFIAGS